MLLEATRHLSVRYVIREILFNTNLINIVCHKKFITEKHIIYSLIHQTNKLPKEIQFEENLPKIRIK